MSAHPARAAVPQAAPQAAPQRATQPAPPAAQAAALALARSLAWGLWWGGWLVLGAFGHQHQPLWAAGLGTLAAWLLCIAGCLAWPRAWSRAGLLVALGLGSLLVAAGWLLQQAAWLVPGWALLVVAASRTVQPLRRGHTTPSPWWPACAGAACAWALAGDPTALHTGAQTWALPLAVAGASALLAGLALRPGQAPPPAACRAALFDCAFPARRRAGTGPTGLAHQAAWLAMLPMMAALPAMADWCSSGGWSPSAVTALHLLAMLAPAGCLHGPARWRPGPGAVAVCLLAGGLALWWWPGLQGLMAAALLHGVAWSLAWTTALSRRHPDSGAPRGAATAAPVPTAQAPAWAGAVLAAAALWALGTGLHHAGPAALQTAHAVLALCGLVAGLRTAWSAIAVALADAVTDAANGAARRLHLGWRQRPPARCRTLRHLSHFSTPAMHPPTTPLATPTPPTAALQVLHNLPAHRFEATVAGQQAVCAYRQQGQVLDLHHTWVPPASQGQGHAAALVQAALAFAREQGLKVRPSCSYVAVYMRRHPETQDLLAP